MPDLVRIKGPFYELEARITPSREWKRITDGEVFMPYPDLASAKAGAKQLAAMIAKSTR